MAIATAADTAGAWRAMPLAARARVDINGLGADGWPMPSGRAGGVSGAVLAVMVVAAMVAGSTT